MITGVHAVIYTTDAEADRAFFRDVLGFASVDAGRGWLIFELPPAELAAHPHETGGGHELYLMCDDVHATVRSCRPKASRSPTRSATRDGASSRRSRCPAAVGSGSTSRVTRARCCRRPPAPPVALRCYALRKPTAERHALADCTFYHSMSCGNRAQQGN